MPRQDEMARIREAESLAQAWLDEYVSGDSGEDWQSDSERPDAPVPSDGPSIRGTSEPAPSASAGSEKSGRRYSLIC